MNHNDTDKELSIYQLGEYLVGILVALLKYSAKACTKGLKKSRKFKEPVKSLIIFYSNL